MIASKHGVKIKSIYPLHITHMQCCPQLQLQSVRDWQQTSTQATAVKLIPCAHTSCYIREGRKTTTFA